MGAGVGWLGGGKGKNWDNCNEVNDKIIKKKKENRIKLLQLKRVAEVTCSEPSFRDECLCG